MRERGLPIKVHYRRYASGTYQQTLISHEPKDVPLRAEISYPLVADRSEDNSIAVIVTVHTGYAPLSTTMHDLPTSYPQD